ncbi:HlyD family efflux transporter periplasmic adaptor subunit [Dyadobacter sp. MSC1_007]|jgi:multidrug resistance efflux pump|uniref:HlyD family efflux transporter periplasmic adaptor subunit n=1 Tax=Dyadobacter sp. MSC1_007 TaxID=2909264 RepID=UPI00202E3D06|nr:HlyD family efflux transporter periplasmic adaptor subunit [Dyadobacter sp. MSC1_007]
MPTKAIIFAELHSEEVHEIITRPPNWLVRFGMTLLLGLMTMLISACWLIRYPDIIPAPVILTAIDPPRSVIVRNEGKLAKLLIADGATVRSGQLLAFCESTADPQQVLDLNESLIRLASSVKKGDWSSIDDLEIQRYSGIGELQNDFHAFTQKLSELKSFLKEGFYQKKRMLLLDDIADLQDLEHNLSEQLTLVKRDYSLAQDEFRVHEKLYENKVIPTLDFGREKSKLLSKEQPLKSLASSLIQNRVSTSSKQKEILELDNAVQTTKNGFLQNLQTLQSSIDVWKQRYTLTAPVAGRVSFSSPWSEQQHLTSGQEFLMVEPEVGQLAGIVKIPQTNLGKIEEGQRVLIKLDGYPYKEYGIVEGNITKLSPTPGRDSLYWGYISLPNQLKTKYKKTLFYRNGMKGTAEIVTKDRRLIERLVLSIRNGKEF